MMIEKKTTESRKAITLKETVREVIRNYFTQLRNEKIIDFYSIFLEEIEIPLLEIMINKTNNNQVQMAKILGISRGTLRKKLKQYGLLG